MPQSPLTRRAFLGAGTAAFASAPYIKAGRSAGTLSLGLWDHWVPGVNQAIESLCLKWGAANNVEVTVDFITNIGNKLLLTAQAESRAQTGHDLLYLPNWGPTMFRRSLEPLDDVIEEIVAVYGPIDSTATHLARLDGAWRAAPAPSGSLAFAQASRTDLFAAHAGIDLKAVFPFGGSRDPGLVEGWNYDAFLSAATALHDAGYPFGAGIAPTPDSAHWLGQLFAAFGVVVADESGEPRINSEETRLALDYLSRLTAVMPEGVYAWDDAGNNRWLISGQGSSIFNPPSAWVVAKRDNPAVARHVWHHDSPRGPAGRFRAMSPAYWGVWSFSGNIGAAKALCRHVNTPAAIGHMLRAAQGFDLPVFPRLYETSDVWDAAGPPAGTLYNYPLRGDEETYVVGYPAPPDLASHIFAQRFHANLVARVTQGDESIDDAISWAENELEGYMRG